MRLLAYTGPAVGFEAHPWWHDDAVVLLACLGLLACLAFTVALATLLPERRR